MVTTLATVISDALERLGKSQMWLAEQVDVSPQAVTKWMQTGQISREKATEVARALGMSIDELLGGVSPKGAQIGHAIDQLSDQHKQEVLDFVRYKFERSEGLIASDKAAHYVAMIDRIKADMDARKKAEAQEKPPPRRKRRR